MTDRQTPDAVTKPKASAESPLPTSRRRTLRWQLIVLIAALALILGTAMFMLLRPDGGGLIGGEAAPRDIPVIESQVYSEAIAGEPLLVNPLLATSQADRDLAALIFSGLTRVDEFGQPAPDLAESWDVSGDSLTYTFHLRSDVTWQDGEPFTANDVAFTMSLLRDPDFPGPTDLGMFWRTVETYATDDQTVEFVLTQPLSSFPEYAGIGILPAHLLGGIGPAALVDDPFNLQPVGTGPLWWESMAEDGDATAITLRPNDRFYDATRRVQLDGVILRFYEDTERAFRALGPEAQGYGGMTSSQLEAALESTGLNLYSARLPVYAAVIFNQQNAETLPFFQEEDVRLALVVALNRPEIVAGGLGNEAVAADSTILPGTWAHNSTLTPSPFDPERAAQLLDGAGWVLDGTMRAKEGRPLAFTLLVNDSVADRALGEAIREQWGAVGVDVTVEPVSAPELLERLQIPAEGNAGRRFDAALVEFSQGRLADPDPYAFWHDSQIAEGQNYSGFSDRDIDEALELARSDPNGVRRAELYRSFQQWFIDHAAAVLLYNPVYHYAVSCQVEGVQLQILVSPSDRFRNIYQWQIASPDRMAEVCPG